MNIKKLTLNSAGYPPLLAELGKSAPKQLYHVGGALTELLQRPAVTIVGSRRISLYGQRVTAQLAKEIAEQGIVIVSGLAYGVDAVAQRAALEAGGLCIAVLPSPLDNIAPVRNRQLATDILEAGGALVSEYASGEPPVKQNFIARNRIMAGLTKVTVITEAAAGSGARHTARYAFDHNRTVLAVPGSIYSEVSVGTNNMLKSPLASPVTELQDVLTALGLAAHQTKPRQVKGSNANEQKLLDLMLQGISDGDQLLQKSGLSVSHFAQSLTMLEISGKIRALGANHWAIY